MRTAAVVIPVCTIAAAAGLASLSALAPHRPPPAHDGDSCPATCGVRVADLPPQPPAQPPEPDPDPRYTTPVGGYFLSSVDDYLLGGHQAVPLLFLLDDRELDGARYGWYMRELATAMVQELGDVLDDGCAAGCSPRAVHVRELVRAFMDDETRTTDAPHASHRERDDAGITIRDRTIAIRARAGATAVDVHCTCSSWTVGMRMWNDIVSCEATVRDHGRSVATYRPRQLSVEDKESVLEPVEAWDQTVELAGGGTLVTETGWSYQGDNRNTPLKKTTPRTGPHWR